MYSDEPCGGISQDAFFSEQEERLFSNCPVPMIEFGNVFLSEEELAYSLREGQVVVAVKINGKYRVNSLGPLQRNSRSLRYNLIGSSFLHGHNAIIIEGRR